MTGEQDYFFANGINLLCSTKCQKAYDIMSVFVSTMTKTKINVD